MHLIRRVRSLLEYLFVQFQVFTTTRNSSKYVVTSENILAKKARSVSTIKTSQSHCNCFGAFIISFACLRLVKEAIIVKLMEISMCRK